MNISKHPAAFSEMYQSTIKHLQYTMFEAIHLKSLWNAQDSQEC